MSYPTRSLPSTHRNPSGSIAPGNLGQSPVLLSRIQAKKVELENLLELRDMSAGLAKQMETLEEKLSTLSNGTEAVAAVLSNWHNVLRAINLASATAVKSTMGDKRPVNDDVSTTPVPLPQTLVRIPTQQATLNAQPESVKSAE